MWVYRKEGGGRRRVIMELREFVSFLRGSGSFGQVVAEDGANVPYYYHRPPLTAVVRKSERNQILWAL